MSVQHYRLIEASFLTQMEIGKHMLMDKDITTQTKTKQKRNITKIRNTDKNRKKYKE